MLADWVWPPFLLTLTVSIYMHGFSMQERVETAVYAHLSNKTLCHNGAHLPAFSFDEVSHAIIYKHSETVNGLWCPE